MGLYNGIFGQNENAGALLYLLGLEDNDFYRYRDCYLSENSEIAVYTRGGGGNRDGYDDEMFLDHPLYIKNEDDDFDSTYATFYFRIPENANQQVLAEIYPGISRNDLWIKTLAGLSK